MFNRAKILQWLIQIGANMRTPVSINNVDYGYLDVACLNNSIECIHILIKNGYDININDKYGTSALYTSMDNCVEFDVVKILVENGINLLNITLPPRTLNCERKLCYINHVIESRSKCKLAILQIIMIRKFKTSDLNIINHDMIQYIARLIWNSKFEIDTWIKTSEPNVKKK